MQLRPKACIGTYYHLPVKKARWIVLIESCYDRYGCFNHDSTMFSINIFIEPFFSRRNGKRRGKKHRGISQEMWRDCEFGFIVHLRDRYGVLMHNDRAYL